MTQQRLDKIEDEFEAVKQMLSSAAGYAESANEGLVEQLENIVELLNRNYQVQLSQFSEFQRTTNAALERIDRVLDYLLRQQQGER